MSTTTEKLKMVLPEGGDPADIDQLNNAYKHIESDAGLADVPVGSYVGKTYFRTAGDSNELQRYYGPTLGFKTTYENPKIDIAEGGPYIDKPVDTSLVVVKSGWEIYYYKLMVTENAIPEIVISCRRTSDYSVPSHGNVVNTPMVQITDPRFNPTTSSNALRSEAGGVNARGNIDRGGNVMLAAIQAGAKLEKGDEIMLCGRYFAERVA